MIDATTEPLVAKYETELTTEVLPLKTFYLAEEYHQKYSLQRHARILKAFRAMYPDFQDFNDSTAAARLNGFTAGRGSQALFESEKDSYGIEMSELEKAVR